MLGSQIQLRRLKKFNKPDYGHEELRENFILDVCKTIKNLNPEYMNRIFHKST